MYKFLIACLLTVLVGLSLLACSAPVGITAEAPYSRQAELYPTEQATLAETLAYWDRTVGWRKTFTLEVYPRPAAGAKPHAIGDATCTEGRIPRIRLYVERIPPGCLRHTLLHELVHIHATCSPRDHVPESNQVMSPVLGTCWNTLDPGTVLRVRLQGRWGG
jgi:hypothetical protein